MAKTKTTTAETKDQIVEMATTVDGLSKTFAIKKAKTLVETGDKNEFFLGGVLARIKDNEFFEQDNFKDYVTEELDYGYRKAMNLIQIYTTLLNLNIVWEDVSEHGWSKLARICPILTEDNCADVIKQTKGLTAIQTDEWVKAYKKEGATDPGAAVNFKTFSVKLVGDQADVVDMGIDKAMTEANTDNRAVALEFLCQSFITGGALSPKDALEKMGSQGAIDMFNEIWPDLTLYMDTEETEETEETEGAEEPDEL